MSPFAVPPRDGPICQAEILSNIIQHTIDISGLSGGALKVDRRAHPFAIVISQDCDLDQDGKSRTETQRDSESQKAQLKSRLIPGILFLEVTGATDLRGRSDINSTLWSRIKINKDERYHFIEAFPLSNDLQAEGGPELAIDFKRYFTIPTEEVYAQISAGLAKRRTMLVTPYAQHLSQRFTSFLARVALPREFESV